MKTAKALSARAEKHLSKLIRSDGETMTLKAWIDKLLANGGQLSVVQVVDEKKRKDSARTMMIMKRGWVPFGNELHPETIRFRKLEKLAHEATKPEYRIHTDETTFFELKKTEYDYAMSLQD